MNQRQLGALYLALAASIWGGMYVVSKVVLAFISPLQLVWLRYVIAIVTLVAAGIAARQSWKIQWRDVPLIIAIGISGYAISIYAQFLGTKLSTAQMGSVITSATPAFMVVFARFLLAERVTLRKVVSVVLATIGVVLIVGLGPLSPSIRLGGLILFVAALTWGLMSVLVKRVPAHYSQLVVTTYGIAVATLLLTPFALVHIQAVAAPLSRPTIWAGVLYLGVVSTAGAFFLWNKGLQMLDAASGGLYFFFQPLVGSVLGWLLLGETVGIPFFAGAVLILAGVAFVVR